MFSFVLFLVAYQVSLMKLPLTAHGRRSIYCKVPMVATPPKVGSPQKLSTLSFFNYVIKAPNAFIVFQLQFMVKFNLQY